MKGIGQMVVPYPFGLQNSMIFTVYDEFKEKFCTFAFELKNIVTMSSWQDKATKALDDSLHPVPQELNVIDWICANVEAVELTVQQTL